jgi:hypothetical protein
MMPKQLYEWPVLKIPAVTCEYFTVEDWQKNDDAGREVQESLNPSRYS